MGRRSTKITGKRAARQLSKKKGKRMTTCWDLAEKVAPHARRMLLYGPSGTGKTTLGQLLAQNNSRKLIVVTMTEDTPMSELRGHYMIKGGEMVWHDGPCTDWWRTKGAVLVINEINMTGGDVLGYLHGLLDDEDRAQMTLPTGEMISPSGGQQIIATMNGEPSELISAILDRFPVTIKINEIHPKALVRIKNERLREIAAGSIKGEEDRRVSVRAFFEYERLAPVVGKTEAAQAIFGSRSKELQDAMAIFHQRT